MVADTSDQSEDLSINLEVKGGPQSGTTVELERSIVSIGRGSGNDLVLTDGLVSHKHGELVRSSDGFLYRDLQSRHGTLVKLDHITVNLYDRERPQEISLIDGAQLVLGESIVYFTTTEPKKADIETARSPQFEVEDIDDGSPGLTDERIVTRSQVAIEAVAQKLYSKDRRLASIFKLSRQLNATSDLDEILNLLCDATFEAFPTANFFAITVLPGPTPSQEGKIGQIRPLIQRQRFEQSADKDTPLLSQSLLEQVAKSRDSVLFVRDEAGGNLSQSIIQARIQACLAAPLVIERGLLGIMQTDTRGLGGLFSPEDLDLFTVMAAYAAFAIERVRLNESIRSMFDGFVSASVTAIDARDPATAGHSARVAEYTMQLARAVVESNTGPFRDIEFSQSEIVELRYAAILHDYGKIGVPERILVKAERLYPNVQRTVAQRFETIRTKLAFDAQRRLLEQLASEGRAPTDSDLADIDAQIQLLGKTLDKMLAEMFTNQRLRVMDVAVYKRIEDAASLTFTDLRGIERPYLLPSELEHLLIPEGTLTDHEMGLMRGHAGLSRELLEQIPWSEALSNIPCFAGWHHEKLDGSGYPDGLAGDDIPIQARILTISDIFDALTATDRPYRHAITPDRALNIIRDEAIHGWLDLNLAELFAQCVNPLVRRESD